MKLLESAINSGTQYSYLHFFQGSDLPIKNQDAIHNFFDKNHGLQFVNIEKKSYQMAQNKCYYRHFFCHNKYFRTNKFVKILNFGFVEIQKILSQKINTDITLFQGSALFSITRDCATYILSRKEEIYNRFRWSLAADEVFIQTILMDSKYKDYIANIDYDSSCNARLIDRSRPDGKNSPHIWRSNEFEYIVNQPENICFARKFIESVDFDIVSKIKAHIIR